jgi:hypothetical protein
MIGNGIRLHHHTETVASQDQAVSLVNYLTNHGLLAFQDSPDAVMITMECPTEEIAAEQERIAHMLVTTWQLFWEHTDQGVFDLPIYHV